MRPRDRDPGRGRRLTPSELAEEAAKLGLDVSTKRYQPETVTNRAKRAFAYGKAKKFEDATFPQPAKSRVPVRRIK